jgi:hypothetical protein
MCNCKKKKEPIPTPVSDELSRSSFPDTPEGQHAFEMSKWGKEQGKEKEEEFDYFNNIDVITPIQE